MRVWHSAWSWLKLIVAAESVAGNTRTGMFTRLILRKPFQVGLAAMGTLSVPRPSVPSPKSLVPGPWTNGRRTSDQGTRDCPISEQISDLKLDHPRWIDVRQRRERIGRRARCDDLAEGRVHRPGVPVGRLGAAEDVSVVGQVEPLQPQQDRMARALQATLDEESHVLGAGAPDGRFLDHLAVHDGPIVVGAVAVVVYTRSGVERTRGRELHQRAGGDVVRQVVANRDDGAVLLVDHAQAALLFAEARDVGVVGSDAVAVGFGGVGRLR